jgi:DNA-binding NtrC family response regulator
MPVRTRPLPASILVVDDEPLIRDSLGEYLQQEGFAVIVCGSGEEALTLAREHRFDIAICDVNLPGIDGIDVLQQLQQISPETFVLLITAYAHVDNAVEALRRGAQDFLTKPIILEEVHRKINRLMQLRHLVQENQWLRRELHREDDSGGVIGKSPAMERVFDLARRVAPMRSTVLILGESGTGKEVLARFIHKQAVGEAGEARFLALNCAAIPNELIENQLFGHRKGSYTGADRDQPGIFVHAGTGTVFLDEIGEMPLATQAKLLRAIEQKEVLPVGAHEPVQVEARIIAATNKDLAREVEKGHFRDDLYYRLNVVSLRLPPLRERREDIPLLVDFLCAKHAKTIGKRILGVSAEARQVLESSPWRGNVRELDNALQRAIIFCEGEWIVPADLPPDLLPQPNDPWQVDDLGKAMERFERLHIERILRQNPDKREAARKLNIGLSSLYRKIELLGIQSPADVKQA